MKKIILVAIALIATLTVSAQSYIGGSFGIIRDMNKNKTEFTILPEYGYNLNKTWAVGATFGYQYLYDNGLDSHMGIISPYARWSFFRTKNNLVNLFVDGGIGVGIGSSQYDGFKSRTSCIWNIGLKPGIAFNITDKFTVLAHVGFFGYEGANNAAKAAGYSEKFGLNLTSLNLNFGLYYNF